MTGLAAVTLATVIVALTWMIVYLVWELFKSADEQRALNRALRDLDDEIARMDRVIMTQEREIEVCRAAFASMCQEEKT